MSNNSANHETVVVEHSTAPIHEVTETPTTGQTAPLGKREFSIENIFCESLNLNR
jgi:hypothetical protein